MKSGFLLFFLLALSLTSCNSIKIPEILHREEKVRLTVYWKKGSGSDRWSRRGISSTGESLINKSSVAVDPEIIPYGSTVEIPELNIVAKAVDTGTAVKNKTASRKMGLNVPVVDLFFDSKADALVFANESPHFVSINVYKQDI